MTVETVNFPIDVDPSLPLFNDPRKEGDDHIRLSKKALRMLARTLGGSVATGVIASDNLAITAATMYVLPEGSNTSDNLVTFTMPAALQVGALVAFSVADAAKPVTLFHGTTTGHFLLTDQATYTLNDGRKYIVFLYNGDVMIEMFRTRVDGARSLDQRTGTRLGLYYYGSVEVQQDSGQASLDLDPNPLDHTSAGVVRMFLRTNTTGFRGLQMFIGNNTGTLATQIAVNGSNTGVDVYNPWNFLNRTYLRGDSSNPLAIGAMRIFHDGNGWMRMKWAGDPTFDTDGTVFGGLSPGGWDFVSPLTAAPTSNPMGVVRINHNLGVVPTNFDISLVCRNASLGYNPGERMRPWNSDSGSGQHSMHWWADASQIGIFANSWNTFDKNGANLQTLFGSPMMANWWIQAFAKR